MQKTNTKLFDSISERYDFYNTFLSLGIDRLWRRKYIKMVSNICSAPVLDVCTGTGDIAARLQKKGFETVGCDISIQMLKKAHGKKIAANAEQLPFKDNLFACVTIAFGIRNIDNIEKFLDGVTRVLQEGGHIAILELTMPSNFIIRKIYSLYLSLIVQRLGGLLTHKFSAYKYLTASIKNFMTPQELSQIMTGFNEIKIHKLTFGMASIIIGKKQ